MKLKTRGTLESEMAENSDYDASNYDDEQSQNQDLTDDDFEDFFRSSIPLRETSQAKNIIDMNAEITIVDDEALRQSWNRLIQDRSEPIQTQEFIDMTSEFQEARGKKC